MFAPTEKYSFDSESVLQTSQGLVLTPLLISARRALTLLEVQGSKIMMPKR